MTTEEKDASQGKERKVTNWMDQICLLTKKAKPSIATLKKNKNSKAAWGIQCTCKQDKTYP